MLLQKAIEKIAGKHSLISVFDDFIQMSICAFAHGRMEEEYLAIAKKYDKKELKEFGECLGAMVMDYENSMDAEGNWEDVLGNYYELVNSSMQSSKSGQFFTPACICTLMARTIDDEDDKRDRITVNDCAAGSGRNLIAHARLKWNTRFKAMYIAQDIDYRCVKMCALNFVMFGMAGVVIHMNTLSMEVYSGYRVWVPETGMGITPLNKNQCLQWITTAKEKDVVAVQNTTQPTLF